MTTQGPGEPGAIPPPGRTGDVDHDTVGAYALGVLDADEATAFEEHLADCERCAGQLEELVGMGPLLAALADLPDAPDQVPAGVAGAAGTRGGAASGAPRSRDRAAELLPTARPGPGLADRLLVDLAAHRRRRRLRTRYLAAAAAVLVVGGPLTVLAAQESEAPPAPSESVAFAQMGDKVHATDAVTKVSATIGLAHKPWGTDTVLELKHVKGPLKCSLIAVGTDGSRETMSSWSVSSWGYGIPGSTWPGSEDPLYVHGAAALDLDHIDHFEVRTFDGRQLVSVNAQGDS